MGKLIYYRNKPDKMNYPHHRDFLSSAKALSSPEVYPYTGSWLNVLADTMNYFLAHPEEFRQTSPEYQYLLTCKCADQYSQTSMYQGVIKKLYTLESLAKIVDYFRHTSISGIHYVRNILMFMVFFGSEDQRIFLITKVFDALVDNKDFFLAHESFAETVKMRLTDLVSEYPLARHYYNILFPPQNTKRYEEPLEGPVDKYRRLT